MSAPLLAQVVVQTLRQAGVRAVVLCPGSRSAPLALELERLARTEGLDLHVRIDERSAGFLALGLARSRPGELVQEPGQWAPTRRPVAVVTTSGTAVGNLLPAVMEAAHSGAPLVVVSADRPASMVHTGANQTTDQTRLFGRFVRGEGRVSNLDGSPRAWAYQVGRLCDLASGTLTRDPGPVHLDVELSEPLLAPAAENQDPTAGGRRRVTFPPPAETEYPVANDGRPTVVLVGDATPDEGARARRFAADAGLPLLAEPSSNARAGAALRTYRLLLGSPLADEIGRVVVFGHPTLSRPVSRLLARDDIETVVVCDTARPAVPPGGAGAVVPGARVSGFSPARDDGDWLERWRVADREASSRLDAMVAEGPLTGPAVAAAVVASIGPDGALVAGSSNPIRDLDLAPVPAEAFPAYANRGLAGIDGTIATAQGIALASGRPVTALLGDLTFLHDVGSLLVGPLERRPRLRVVVANDDGGSIFHTLEQGDPAYATGFERVFGTPTGVSVEPLAQAYGWGFTRATTRDELVAALAAPIEGLEIVEVPLTRDGRRDLDARVRDLGTSQPE